MVKTEKACFDCGYDNCTGCPNYGASYSYYICDECKDEQQEVHYRYNGRDLCRDCMLKVFCEEHRVEEVKYDDDLPSDELYNKFQEFLKENYYA